jgi:dTDP-4-dehydrorhamnose reductase
MLGWELVREFGTLLGERQVTALDRAGLDICDERAVEAMLERIRPAVVLNGAGFTNVDAAESQRDAAFRANVTGPGTLARACAAAGTKLVHFSTDQVFDGRGESPRLETERPAPLNYYATTKFLGENEVLGADSRALVLRVQWLYGEKKNRFHALREKSEFGAFTDQFGAPTWTKEIAENLVEMLRRDASGIFHFSYDDYGSWADIFELVKAELGLKVRLVHKKTAEAHLPAARPRFSVMSNRKLVALLGRKGMGSWKDPLRRFLRL